jgi:hypothetical protein
VHDTERKNAAAAQKNNSIVECVASLGFTKALQCSLEAAETPYQQTEDYYDLKAQQDMAKWALLMLIVTSVGVVYVAQTLNITRQANERFADAAKMELRAYVAPVNFIIGPIESGKPISFSFETKNFGQTPARNVCHTYRIFTASSEKAVPKFGSGPIQSDANYALPPGHVFETQFSTEDVNTADEASRLLSGKAILGIRGYLVYRDIFGRRHFSTFNYILNTRMAKGVRLVMSIKHNRSN